MKKLRSALLIILLVKVFFVNAQNNYEDVVYLKNGSVIHGIIIEQIPNESIKIKSGQNTFVFKITEVKKMTKEEVNAPPSTNVNTVTNSSKFVGLFEVINSPTRKLYFHIKEEGGNYTMKCYSTQGGKIYDFSTLHCSTDKVVLTKADDNLLSVGINLITLRFKPITGTLVYNNGDCKDEMKKIADIGSSATLQDITDEINGVIKDGYSKITSENVIQDSKLQVFPYKPIAPKQFVVNNLPIIQDATIKLTKIETESTDFNISEIQGRIIMAFQSNNRFEKNSPAKSASIFEYEFTINGLSYAFDKGLKVISKEPYMGYNCVLNFSYKVTNVNSNTLVYQETRRILGGNPKLNSSKEDAYADCLELFDKTLNTMIWYYNPIVCNFIAITSQDKKGIPKEVTLNNAKYFDYDSKVQFAFVDENDIYYDTKGELKYKNTIATGDFSKKQDGNIICKLTSGSGNIKDYIDSNKKFFAVTSMKQLNKVQ